ncbi:MAG: ketoacyl-synthetase C-terminal extension domain-containing protein [Isosphaeraceae bacterium]
MGHSLTASGSAGLLKLLMALAHQTLPPTANFNTPGPKIDLDGSPFRILQAAEPWPRRDPRQPRRAAISGFGFGGINAHALIEEWLPEAEQSGAAAAIPRNLHTEPIDEPVAIVGIGTALGRYRGVRPVQERLLSGRVDPTGT